MQIQILFKVENVREGLEATLMENVKEGTLSEITMPLVMQSLY